MKITTLLFQGLSIFIYQIKTMNVYDYETNKTYPDFNPKASQEPQAYGSKKTLKLKHNFLMKLKFVKCWEKRWNDSIQLQAL